jgi:hypothetical protein
LDYLVWAAGRISWKRISPIGWAEMRKWHVNRTQTVYANITAGDLPTEMPGFGRPQCRGWVVPKAEGRVGRNVQQECDRRASAVELRKCGRVADESRAKGVVHLTRGPS